MVLLSAVPVPAAADAVPLAADPVPLPVDPVPLAVDLDGTVLRTDCLIESLFVLARNTPLCLLKLPGWWLKGPAFFKQRLAATAMPDIELLPQRAAVVGFLRQQQRLGRTLILATSADMRLAREAARVLGLFDRVIASDGGINLSPERKRDRLVELFGHRGFDYLGHGARDTLVWHAARRALIPAPSPRLAARIARVTPVEAISREPGAGWRNYLHALRPLHWVKNGLVFVPLVAVHRFFDVPLLVRTGGAFAAFCLCASALYLLNDCLDLPADRRHPYKKERMLASGRVPLEAALLMLPLLLAAAFAIAFSLSAAFAAVLCVYSTLMIAYSLRLKDLALIDVLVLALGYSLRVAAGSVATGVRISAWLLTFCVFLFFSLALIKRYGELLLLEAQPATAAVHARGYLGIDKAMLAAQGIAAGYLAVLVLALYTNTDIGHRLYRRHEYFWGICLLLLYWISYLWMMVGRGRIPDDPVIFALTDRRSRWTIAAMGVIAILSL
jgi:4-hydroxybenzoate polyprenyltransferase